MAVFLTAAVLRQTGGEKLQIVAQNGEKSAHQGQVLFGASLGKLKGHDGGQQQQSGPSGDCAQFMAAPPCCFVLFYAAA